MLLWPAPKRTRPGILMIRNAVAEELSTTGWVILISNDLRSVKKTMRFYRDEDVV